jgi:hypothetical protein
MPVGLARGSVQVEMRPEKAGSRRLPKKLQTTKHSSYSPSAAPLECSPSPGGLAKFRRDRRRSRVFKSGLFFYVRVLPTSYMPTLQLVKLAPARVENESGCWQGPGAWGGRAGPQLSLCSYCETSVYTCGTVSDFFSYGPVGLQGATPNLPMNDTMGGVYLFNHKGRTVA